MQQIFTEIRNQHRHAVTSKPVASNKESGGADPILHAENFFRRRVCKLQAKQQVL